MKRLALALMGLAAAALPSAVPGAGCSPLDCAPSASSLSVRMLAVRPNGVQGLVRVVDLANGETRWRLPSGILTGRTLVHQDGPLLTWFDAATGARVADAVAPGGQLVGASARGELAVLMRSRKGQTTFTLIGPSSLRSATLSGSNWGFDALRGNRLFLLRYLRSGYEVRLFDVALNRLDTQPLKDAEDEALIRGTPWERLVSRDGRYVFTLYIGSSGASMIHELDLRTATARCIDLPGDGDFNAATAYGLALSRDGRTLWAASTAYGVVAAIDVASATVREKFRFTPSRLAGPIAPAVALSPNGDVLALGLADDLFLANLKTQHVRKTSPHAAIALGFSPDGKRLWMVDEQSRVSAMRVAA